MGAGMGRVAHTRVPVLPLSRTMMYLAMSTARSSIAETITRTS